jgi:hypothetical protein
MKRRGVLIKLAEVIGPTEVRLFFSDGTVVERPLPGVKKLRRVRIVDEGLGLDPGDGKGEMSASMLNRPCKGRHVYRTSLTRA